MSAMLSSERDREVLRSFAHRIDAGDAGAHNNLGVLYFKKGMTDEAVAQFTRALDLDPRMTIATRNLEIAYFNSGYYDRRIEAFRERLEAFPRDRDARWDLGRTYALLGETRPAIEAFSTLLRDDPADVDAMLHLALAESAGGDPELATRWLRRAIAVAPDRGSLHLQLGQVLYHRGLNDEALPHLQRAVELQPDDADAWYLLGFVLGDQGRHDEAQAATRRAMQLNPSLGRAHANLSLERLDACSHERVRAAREARGLADAMEVAEDGQLAHFNLGLAFRHKGYLTEALREYRLALERGEAPALVMQAMAEVHLLRRDPGAAVSLYDRLLQEQPTSPKLWNERGIALHQEGRHVDAAASYHRSIAADGHYVLALNNLGVAQFHAARPDLALAAFQRALQLQPGFIKGRLNLALLRFRQQEHQRCLEAYRHVLRVVPEQPVAWNGVGLVLAHLRRFEEARNAFARAIEARPDFAEAHYNLSFALSNLGDFAGSLRETKRALELDAYYTPQKFELAADLEFEDPLLEVAPDLAGAQREAVAERFDFQPGALDQLFRGLGGESTASPPNGAPDGRAPFAAAMALAERGDVDRASAEVRRAMARGAPRDLGLVALGDLFLSQGATGEALERYREARTLSPALSSAVVGELRALILLRRHAEGGALAMWAEQHLGSDVDALLLIAEIYVDTYADSDADSHAGTDVAAYADDAAVVAAIGGGVGDVDPAVGPTRAQRVLARACDLAPSRPDVHQGIARVAHAMGDEVLAIDAFRRAIALDGDFAACRVQLAELLRAQGRLGEAERELEAAVASVPTYADAVLTLASVQREGGRARETIAPLATFLERDPYHLDALASLAESLLLAGRADDATFAVRRVLRFDPEHVAALYLDGARLADAGRADDAIAQWERVEALEPASAHARRARQQLRMVQQQHAGVAGGRHEQGRDHGD